MTDLPMLKGKKLTDTISIPVEPGIKEELTRIRLQYGVDTLEWLRGIIRKELPELRSKVTS